MSKKTLGVLQLIVNVVWCIAAVVFAVVATSAACDRWVG